MLCPHCSTVVHFDWFSTGAIRGSSEGFCGYSMSYAACPSCENLVVKLMKGSVGFNSIDWIVDELEWEKMIYPRESRLENIQDVPAMYVEDYEEAVKVISSSPKASAALTRRLLQNILREEFKIHERSLSNEIMKFVERPGIPSHLTSAVDAIRIIGNFAAHPTKDKSTGEIVAVEFGEAEWLLEVIEALFDFTFIQPVKLRRRKDELNEKLEKIGKPTM